MGRSPIVLDARSSHQRRKRIINKKRKGKKNYFPKGETATIAIDHNLVAFNDFLISS